MKLIIFCSKVYVIWCQGILQKMHLVSWRYDKSSTRKVALRLFRVIMPNFLIHIQSTQSAGLTGVVTTPKCLMSPDFVPRWMGALGFRTPILTLKLCSHVPFPVLPLVTVSSAQSYSFYTQHQLSFVFCVIFSLLTHHKHLIVQVTASYCWLKWTDSTSS